MVYDSELQKIIYIYSITEVKKINLETIMANTNRNHQSMIKQKINKSHALEMATWCIHSAVDSLQTETKIEREGD